jgi:phospholipase D1/2
MTGPILLQGRNCMCKAHARRAAFLVDGEAYFTAFVQAARRAEHSILIAGWDIDSRIPLLRHGDGKDPRLGKFLDSLVASRPELHVNILVWDFVRLFAMDQMPLPVFELRWRAHTRVHFHMDAVHPTSSAHHQKVVVVDDKVAFVGGMDLTNSRWDTPDHLPDDPRRVDPSGAVYSACHDVQMVVDGEAARCLGNLMRARWLRVANTVLPRPPRTVAGADTEADTVVGPQFDPKTGQDPWPEDIVPDLQDVEVAVARTEPGFREHPPVREVEALWLDAIKAATHSIYIENQYLTSSAVEQALTARLKERRGPEIVAVLSRSSPSWLEKAEVGALRAELLKRLFDADRYSRLRIFYPVIPGAAETFLTVRSKVLVVDDILVRVGSSNLNNRSLILDTECDLAVEAEDNDKIKRGIAHFRNTLLAEHLGTTPEAVAQAVTQKKSLIDAIKSLRGGERTLRLLPDEITEIVETALDEAVKALDIERPLHMERLIDEFIRYDDHPATRALFFKLAGLVLLIVIMATAWGVLFVSEGVDAERISDLLWAFREHPAAPLIVAAGFMAGILAMFPVTLLIGATTLLFDPLHGFLYSTLGVLAGATLAYFIGRMLRRDFVRRIARSRLNRLSKRLATQGTAAVILFRLLPLAPFSLVSLVAGASHIRLRDYLLGTLIGMLPYLLGISFFTELARDVLLTPSLGNTLLLAAVTTVLLAGGAILGKRLMAQEKKDKEKRDGEKQ